MSLAEEYDAALRQRIARSSTGKFAPPHAPKQERAYHLGMASLLCDRGYLNLAQAHAVAAKDCPANCPCEGCESTRREVAERREKREAHKVARRVAA